MVVRHFAWFSRDTGHWLGEWRGTVPRPDVSAIGEARLLALNAWQQDVVSHLADFDCDDQVWDAEALDACPSGGAVCLDVTRFAWPVGDHIWHRWDDLEQMLDWPESAGHKFIEVNLDTLDVVANQHSHRPIRDAVPGQHVFDITGTALEPFWGDIWGRFVKRGERWSFEPTRGAVPMPALEAAPVDLDIFAGTSIPVSVGAQR